MAVSLVTGGTGFVGRHLVRRLLAEGERVRLLTAPDAPVPAEWESEVEIVSGNLTDRGRLSELGLGDGVDTVFHLAGEIRDPSRFDAVNVEGTRNLLSACAGAGRLRVLHLSSVGVIGARRPGVYDETSPCDPREPYEVSKLEGEKIALEFAAAGRLRVTVARPAIVFGPKPNAQADSFLGWMRAIAQGRFRFMGVGDGIANYVYVEDVAAICMALARSEHAVGEIYSLVDPCTIREFVSAAATCLMVPVPGSVPSWTMHAAASAFEVLVRLTRRPVPLTRARVRALASRISYSPDKVRREYAFPVGWKEGICRTLAAYRAASLV